MDTYYMSTAKLIDLLKTAYTKGYHGFLDLADSTVEEMLIGLEENKYSPKDILVSTPHSSPHSPRNPSEDWHELSRAEITGSTTITSSGEIRGMAADSVIVDDAVGTNVLPENISLEPLPDDEINLNTGDG